MFDWVRLSQGLLLQVRGAVKTVKNVWLLGTALRAGTPAVNGGVACLEKQRRNQYLRKVY